MVKECIFCMKREDDGILDLSCYVCPICEGRIKSHKKEMELWSRMSNVKG